MCMCFMQNQNISRRRKKRIVSERHGPERRISEKKLSCPGYNTHFLQDIHLNFQQRLEY